MSDSTQDDKHQAAAAAVTDAITVLAEDAVKADSSDKTLRYAEAAQALGATLVALNSVRLL